MAKEPPLPLAWSPLQQRGSVSGKAWFCFANPTGRFWQQWKENPIPWVKAGCIPKKWDHNKWKVERWLLSDGHLTPKCADMLDNPIRKSEPMPEPKKALPPFKPSVTVPSYLAEKLLEYQVEPANQIFDSLTMRKGAWDCSEMGTGKTYQSLAAALAYSPRVAVVCPLSVVPAWNRAFLHFGARPEFVVNYEKIRNGKVSWILERNGNEFTWNVNQGCVLIFDEAHRCKNKGTLNSRMLHAAANEGRPHLCLSATMAKNPTEMWATGRAVALHDGTDKGFYAFLHKAKYRKFGSQWFYNGGVRNGERKILGMIHRAIFPRRGARVRIAELGDRFPDTQILCEPFATANNTKIAEAWDKAGQLAKRLKAQGAQDHEITMQMMAAYMEARHESERLKVPGIVEMVKEEQAAGRSVVVFVNFTDVREELQRQLKTTCGVHGCQSGERGKRERQEAIDAFQADEERVIVAQIEAGGVGLSLHDINGKYPRTAIILPSDKAVSMKQALGRVHRAGGKSKSRQIVFFASGTIEEDICKKVRETIRNIDALNDGELNPELAF